MVVYALLENSVQSLQRHRKIVLLAHTQMLMAINLKLNVTYAQTAMFVQLQARVTVLCLQLHAQQVSGAVLEFPQIQVPLFVMQDISA